MRLFKTLLWTVAGLTMAGAGLAYKRAVDYREKMFDKKLLQVELEVMEGEGGICLS